MLRPKNIYFAIHTNFSKYKLDDTHLGLRPRLEVAEIILIIFSVHFCTIKLYNSMINVSSDGDNKGLLSIRILLE